MTSGGTILLPVLHIDTQLLPRNARDETCATWRQSGLRLYLFDIDRGHRRRALSRDRKLYPIYSVPHWSDIPNSGYPSYIYGNIFREHTVQGWLSMVWEEGVVGGGGEGVRVTVKY